MNFLDYVIIIAIIASMLFVILAQFYPLREKRRRKKKWCHAEQDGRLRVPCRITSYQIMRAHIGWHSRYTITFTPLLDKNHSRYGDFSVKIFQWWYMSSGYIYNDITQKYKNYSVDTKKNIWKETTLLVNPLNHKDIAFLWEDVDASM